MQSKLSRSTTSSVNEHRFNPDLISPVLCGKSGIIKDDQLINQKQHLRPVSTQQKSSLLNHSMDDQRQLNDLMEGLKEKKTDEQSFRLKPKHLQSAERENKHLYHQRIEDEIPIFFSHYATEKPSLERVAKLPDNQKSYYVVRHAGKRGRDLLTDRPISGLDSSVGQLKTSPLLSSQDWPIRAMRGFASTATLNKARGEYVTRLHQHILATVRPNTTEVHLVRPSRDPYVADNTLNFFTFCEQTELAQALNDLEKKQSQKDNRQQIQFTDHKSLIGLSRTSRTESSPIGRLVQQPFFSTRELAKNDQVVIVDDHIQAGGSILAMQAAAKQAGASVLAAATLSAHPLSEQVKLTPDVSHYLDEVMSQWDPDGKIFTKLGEYGIGRKNLTNTEALILIAHAINPENKDQLEKFTKLHEKYFTNAFLHNIGINPNDPEQVQRFAQLSERQLRFGTQKSMHYINNQHVPEGENDSILPILYQQPKSVDAIVSELETVSQSTRSVIQGSQVEQVAVVDWDDCLRDEKSLNYQMYHNALSATEQEYGSRFQGLSDAVRQVQEWSQEQSKGLSDQRPYLAYDMASFTKKLLANHRLYKKHVIGDFIEKTMPLLKDDEKQTLMNIISANFNRQYHQVLKRKSQGDFILPYPEIKFNLLPGALELLEHFRKSNSRIILISNRGHRVVEAELNALQLMHYFDAVSGTPEETLPLFGPPPASMSAGLQHSLINALSSAEPAALHRIRDDVANHAHPETTWVGRTQAKPSDQRIQSALTHLSIPTQTPIVSYGDQNTDISQMKRIAENRPGVFGVVTNAEHPHCHKSVNIDGIQTSVVANLLDEVAYPLSEVSLR